MSVTVTDNRDAGRYEARVGDAEHTASDGEVVGYIEYRLEDGLIVMPHTKVDPAHEGQGIGSTLVKAALDDVRANRPGVRVVPVCPFIASWVDRHPDYQDLLSPCDLPPAACPMPS